MITSIKLFAQDNNWVSNDIYSSNVKASSPNICFINANTGWAYSGNGIHTTNGGGPIIISSININNENIVKSYILEQNYPNPFNPTTVISFQLSVAGQVVLKVYDVMGREVQTLVNESLKPGTYQASFDASALSSGIYFYTLSAGEFSETKKMLMVK